MCVDVPGECNKLRSGNKRISMHEHGAKWLCHGALALGVEVIGGKAYAMRERTRRRCVWE
jgi:hypothetical protein